MKATRASSLAADRTTEAVWLPMTAPRLTEQAEPLVIAEGEGVYVRDIHGKQYLDSQGGLWCVNVGHNRAEMNQAIVAQLGKIAYYNSFVDTTNPPSLALARRLIEMTQTEDMARVMFTSGGSDSVETALKLARQYWKLAGEATRTKFISLQYAYHGVHFGGTSLNGNAAYRLPYEPLLPGCFQVDSPFLYRNPWTDDPRKLGEICASILDREIAHHGASTVAAFIAEPIQGAGGGVIIPPDNYWPLVRQVCDRHGVLLIADEVITGFGRSGSMFGVRGWGVRPDIMCFAKGLSSAYVPLGATLVNQRIAAAWNVNGPEGLIMHGYTYSGHPLACAAGLAALDLVERDNLPQNAAQVGQYLLERLRPLIGRYSFVGDVRGKGLMAAIDLVADKQTRESFSPEHPLAMTLSRIALREGVIVRAVPSKLIISPPLIFTRQHVDVVVDTLETACKEAQHLAR